MASYDLGGSKEIIKMPLRLNNPTTLWMTGLPCSGKTTLASLLVDKFSPRLMHLDGDVLRKTINSDLGFGESDRIKNIYRASHIAKLFNDAGISVVTSFICPTNNLRVVAEQIIKPSNFVLLYINCPLNACEKRDVKGMYAKARSGEIRKFTGISGNFEIPYYADCTVNTDLSTKQECLTRIMDYMKARNNA